jgi:hypothetical protein
MVSVDRAGNINPKPYLALHQWRKVDGKLLFGQHMRLCSGEPAVISVGDIVCTEPT